MPTVTERPIDTCKRYSLKLVVFTQFTMRLQDYSGDYHYHKGLNARRASEIEGTISTFILGAMSAVDPYAYGQDVKLVAKFLTQCITVNGHKGDPMCTSSQWFLEVVNMGMW